MSTSPEPITYNLTNIKDALMPTAIPGVWKLPLNTYINVSIDEWKECVAEIEKLCAEKWNVKSTYNPKTSNSFVRFSKSYQCHRSGEPPKEVPTARPNQKNSKKV
ncbi:hypothetical protein BC941DRAFT_446354, partial [Chlamydoabsidia padenii]